MGQVRAAEDDADSEVIDSERVPPRNAAEEDQIVDAIRIEVGHALGELGGVAAVEDDVGPRRDVESSGDVCRAEDDVTVLGPLDDQVADAVAVDVSGGTCG